jgi:ABC-2 type transport system ATP-binding protein
LEQFGLTEADGKQAKSYSGGMKRRLDLAASFILAPQVMFLDEPTTGQDPRNRNEVWNVVRELVAGGTTVLLTTHYLEEADQLADQISVIDHGRVIADGTPEQLKSKIGGSRVDIVLSNVDELPIVAGLVERVCGGEAEVDNDRRRVSAPVRDRVATLTEVLRALEDAGILAEDVAVRKPTLDEVFLELTGHRAEEEVAA